MDRFTEILTALGDLVGTDLRPDVRGVCKINMNDTLDVQLEYEAVQERLLLLSFLSDIPPGKFRENILKDALKANCPFPVHGTLSYSERNNKLTLFQYVPTAHFSAPKLFDALHDFIAKAQAWRTAIETGQTAHLVPLAKKGGDNIFGIK